jgi:hypothetical protein
LFNGRKLYKSNEDEYLLKWECTLFFQNNPYTMDTALGISRRVGHRLEAVQNTLNQLVQVNILEKIGETNDAVYRYQEAFSASKIDLS